MGYGGDPGLGLATGGVGTGGAGAGLPGSHQFGSGQFGSVGNIPRLANTAMLDAVQALSPVSAVTVAGGVSNAHFYAPSKRLINKDPVPVSAYSSPVLFPHDHI